MKRLLNDRIVLSAVIFSLLGAIVSISTKGALAYTVEYFTYFLPGFLLLYIIKKKNVGAINTFGSVVMAILIPNGIAVVMKLLTGFIFNIAAMITIGCMTYRVFNNGDYLNGSNHG